MWLMWIAAAISAMHVQVNANNAQDQAAPQGNVNGAPAAGDIHFAPGEV